MIKLHNCLFYRNARLVPYSAKHYSKTVEWLNNPEIYKNFGLTHKVTIESHTKWVDSLENTFTWAIHDAKTNTYAGNLFLFYNLNHNSAYFQVYIGNTLMKGKRLGESSLIAMLNFAFENLKLNRIWLQVLINNTKAIYLYEKIGFVREGIERESHFNKSSYNDQLRYSLLKREWLENKGELVK